MKKRKYYIIFILMIAVLSVSLLILIFVNYFVNMELKYYFEDEIYVNMNYIKKYVADNDEISDSINNIGNVVPVYFLSIRQADIDDQYLMKKYNFHEYYVVVAHEREFPLDDYQVETFEFENEKYVMGKVNVQFSDGTYDAILAFCRVDGYFSIIKQMNKSIYFIIFGTEILTLIIGFIMGKKMENSELRMKHFFENASHELKTPLMSIQGYTEGLKNGILTDVESAANTILKQSDRMESLINELLEHSKLESGVYKMKKDKIIISEFLFRCLSNIEVIAESKNIEIQNFCNCNIHSIIGDRRQLEKAVMSILSNAVKYAKTKIIINTMNNKKELIIEIIDDGNGIDKKDIEHIFERFYKGKNGNIGIGLSMAKEIIEMNKGVIKAQNFKKGTKFTIVLNA